MSFWYWPLTLGRNKMNRYLKTVMGLSVACVVCSSITHAKLSKTEWDGVWTNYLTQLEARYDESEATSSPLAVGKAWFGKNGHLADDAFTPSKASLDEARDLIYKAATGTKYNFTLNPDNIPEQVVWLTVWEVLKNPEMLSATTPEQLLKLVEKAVEAVMDPKVYNVPKNQIDQNKIKYSALNYVIDLRMTWLLNTIRAAVSDDTEYVKDDLHAQVESFATLVVEAIIKRETAYKTIMTNLMKAAAGKKMDKVVAELNAVQQTYPVYIDKEAAKEYVVKSFRAKEDLGLIIDAVKGLILSGKSNIHALVKTAVTEAVKVKKDIATTADAIESTLKVSMLVTSDKTPENAVKGIAIELAKGFAELVLSEKSKGTDLKDLHDITWKNDIREVMLRADIAQRTMRKIQEVLLANGYMKAKENGGGQLELIPQPVIPAQQNNLKTTVKNLKLKETESQKAMPAILKAIEQYIAPIKLK